MENPNAVQKLVKAYIRVHIASLLLGAVTAKISGLLAGIAVFWASIHFTSFLIYRYDLNSLDLQKILR